MNGLYIISLIVAFLSVLPIVILVYLSEKHGKKQLHIICADSFEGADELEQRIREIWWEDRFNSDSASRNIFVLTDNKKLRKELLERLKSDLPQLAIKNNKRLIKLLRNEEYECKKIYHA